LNKPNGKAIEIGCGTGVISIFLAKKGWNVEAFDINPYAIISTKENIIRAGVDRLVSTQEGGLGEEGFRISKDVTLIVWNLPYLSPPDEDEQRLEWIEEASMSDLNEKGWGRLLVEYLEKNIEKINPKLLIILVQRKFPVSPSKTSDWSDLGWSHRTLDHSWLFEEKLEVLAYWKPGLGTSVKKLVECDSTMDEAKKLPQKGWQRIVTEKQIIGRGRRNSQWISKNNDLLATWSFNKSIIQEINPGLIQIVVGTRISNILQQYCKWPNDIVDSKGNKMGGILVEMDSESEHLRIGVGINQLNDKIGSLAVKGWKEKIPQLELNELFAIIDAELSTLFEEHPLLENEINIGEIKSKSWRILSRLISRGYSLNVEEKSARVTELKSDGYLTINSDNMSRNIIDLDSLEWLF
tara:strand:+ start:231 stop:1457 length:1227 start_codon:yes stop_codon:yes gene_type:complete